MLRSSICELLLVAGICGCGSIPHNALVPADDIERELVEHPPVRILMSVGRASSDQAKKLERARQLAEVAVNDPAFRRRVLAFSSKPYGGADKEGFTQAERAQPEAHLIADNSEPLRALLEGNDQGMIQLNIIVTDDGTSPDNFATTDIYNSSAATSINPEWLMRKSVTDADLAENLMHEHMHRLGFEHEHSYSRRRCGSVPYAVGHLVCAVSAGDTACLPGPGARC